MKLSIVSDELKIPQAEAFPLIASWDFEYVELRGLTGGRLPDGDADEVVTLVNRFGLEVTALSPGVFKCRPEEQELGEHVGRLKRTIPLCGRFHTDVVIVFPVQNLEWVSSDPADGNIEPIVVDALREAGTIAGEAGVRIAIENEPGYTAVTARGLAKLIDAIGMDNVGANWDAGNSYPYDPEIDYAVTILGDRVFNVHVKDAWVRDGKRGFDAVGKGEIDWAGQIDALRSAGYDGAIVVETHCLPGVEKSKESTVALRTLIG